MRKHLKLKRKDAAALEEFLRSLRAGLGNNLCQVKLFGSKATGKDEPESDIDVLVVVHDATVETEDQVLDIAFEVNLAHEVYISPRVLSPAILEDPVWKITPFLQAIAKEGIAL